MSIRIPKAGSGTLGVVLLFIGVLLLTAGGIDRNPIAAQDSKVPLPTPTNTPTPPPQATILGEMAALPNGGTLLTGVLTDPLVLITAEGRPSHAVVSQLEIGQGQSLLKAFTNQTIDAMDVLLALAEQSQQSMKFVVTLFLPANETCKAGEGSLLPKDTPVASGAAIELTISPDGLSARLLLSPGESPEKASSSLLPGSKAAQEPAALAIPTYDISNPIYDVTDFLLATPTPTPLPYYDQLIIAQGYGGETIVNVRNLDPAKAPITSIRQSLSGLAGKFLEKLGGGAGRDTFVSSGDLNNDGSPEIVLSFGPVTSDAVYANIIVARNADTREVLGSSFNAFPQGGAADINYNGGEVRTAVGDFIGSGTPQIACAQGQGGHGMVRLYQYTGKPAPLAWEVVGQFYGLPSNLVVQGDTENDRIGLTLAAGDLDNDGRDELLVGQTNGALSQTIFHVLDISDQGDIQRRTPYAGFVPKFRGNGGVELFAADINGDGQCEILVGSMGNAKNFGDSRDASPLSLAGVIAPVVENKQVTGFTRPGGKSVFNVFAEGINPSGAISIVAGEFDGNPSNGKELAVGTGSLLTRNRFEITLFKPAPQARYRLLKVAYDGATVSNITSWIGSGSGFVAFVDKTNPKSGALHLGVIDRGPLKPVLPKPPTTLAIGDFTLTVDHYDTYKWNAALTTISEASGVAWTDFDCNELVIIGTLFGGLEIYPIAFVVVDKVTDPQKQISLEEALVFNPKIRPGQNLVLYLPKEETTRTTPIVAKELASKYTIDPSILELLSPVKGQIKVNFSNCTIAVDPADSTEGMITAGEAFYPTADPYPSGSIELQPAGFTTHLYTLRLTPTSATATAELEFPVSITSGVDCRPAHVDLGEITITQDCQYYKSLPDLVFGPWQIDNTGMIVEGIGLVADFSKTTSHAGVPSLAPEWRGVVLRSGETIPAADNSVISNYGYVRAHYSFSNGLVISSGLSADFDLIDDFQFFSLQPVDYNITIALGELRMDNNKITGGLFSDGKITLPKAAVIDPAGVEITGYYSTLTVQSDMDLYSDSLSIGQEFVWGEFSRTSPIYQAYRASKPSQCYFYLSAAVKPAFWPLSGGVFTAPDLSGDKAAKMETQGIQGALVFNQNYLEAYTPDTPGPKNLFFKHVSSSWMIVGGKGAHSFFRIYEIDNPNDLGPTHESYYQGRDYDGKNVPFVTTLKADPKQEKVTTFKFVDSALYDDDLQGSVRLEGPTKADVPFEEMKLTSTAHIAGARIVLDNPVPLDYWGVDLVENPYQDTAGVMCVKTGQIFLTGAGISEPRHFAQPFWLTWGELLSSGQLDDLRFDYNSSGQKFDGFNFTADGIGLSPWNPADDVDKKNAYLQAGGTVFFDFFGSQYNNIKDFNEISRPGAPYFGRRIELTDDTAFNTQVTDRNIAREWGNSFGAFDYDTRYDAADQDGFVGEGTMQLFDLVEGPLTSSIVLSSTRICMQVRSASDEEHHDFTVGPVANFGQMTRITGCACVTDGQVERVHLSAELETSADVNIALRSASYSNLEFDMTPSTWDMWIYGNMYLSLLAGADIEVTGQAHFAVNRDDAYVEGDVSGSIETSSLLGGGLRADGRLEWHLGAPVSGDSYQSLQGRLAVEVVSAIGSNANEGGFYIGMNAPRERAWVLADAGGHFSLNPNLLPERLTGVYGYVRQSASVNLYIVSGGYEVYVGFGAFLDVGSNDPVATAETLVTGLPDVVGNLGVRIWGEILGGLISASASVNLQILIGLPPGFEGSVELEACALWVFCGSVDVHCGLNETDGFYLN